MSLNASARPQPPVKPEQAEAPASAEQVRPPVAARRCGTVECVAVRRPAPGLQQRPAADAWDRTAPARRPRLEALWPYLLDLNSRLLGAGKARQTTWTSLMREGASGARRRVGYAWLTFAAPGEGGELSYGVRVAVLRRLRPRP